MIKIIDNFFNDNDLKIIQDFALTKAFYTPRFFVDAPERTDQYHYGSRWQFNNKPELLDLFVKQTELKFKIKIKELNIDSGIDQRRLTCFKPHLDDKEAVINIFIMISGPTAVTNGSVFYTDNTLDMHIGFKENRAVLFPSNKLHSPHANKESNITRYSATLFIKDYE